MARGIGKKQLYEVLDKGKARAINIVSEEYRKKIEEERARLLTPEFQININFISEVVEREVVPHLDAIMGCVKSIEGIAQYLEFGDSVIKYLYMSANPKSLEEDVMVRIRMGGCPTILSLCNNRDSEIRAISSNYESIRSMVKQSSPAKGLKLMEELGFDLSEVTEEDKEKSSLPVVPIDVTKLYLNRRESNDQASQEEDR